MPPHTRLTSPLLAVDPHSCCVWNRTEKGVSDALVHQENPISELLSSQATECTKLRVIRKRESTEERMAMMSKSS